jgi:hypothetical protein
MSQLHVSGRHAHALISFVSLCHSSALSLAMFSLLVLLNQIAATATASSSKINKATSLKIILLAKVGALES